MQSEFDARIQEIKKRFLSFSTPDERYSHLIKIGKSLSAFPPHFCTAEKLVPGCQSLLYLHAEKIESKLIFLARSDALISAGLAALLVETYSGLSPEAILRNPPHFLQELGLLASLSPNRSNGLVHIYLRMKQEALKNFLA